jgi:hypothetical protein
MDLFYSILTSAYTKRPLPMIKIQHFTPDTGQLVTYKNFQMYKNATFNIVIVEEKITTVVLVCENQVWYWSKGLIYTHQNFIYRVEYPALANFVYTSWYEKRHHKYILSNKKPFTSHLTFSPNCPFDSPQKTTQEQLEMCLSLWDGPDEENLYNWEMDLIKPWSTRKQDFKIYKNLFNHNKNYLKELMDNNEISFKNLIDLNPFFLELPLVLYNYSIETGNIKLQTAITQRWTIDPFRLKLIER